MALPKPPNELPLIVAEHLDRISDLSSLYRTHNQLLYLLTPLLHKFATQDVGGMTALQWGSTGRP